MSTGAKLGRAAAFLWQQRQRARQYPVEPAGARLGHAAGTVVGQRIASRQPAPGALNTALHRARHTLWSRVGHALHRLGLQISAVLFLFFALGFGAAGIHAWHAERAHSGIPVAASLTQASAGTQLELGLALLFAYFGISSLLRAVARHS